MRLPIKTTCSCALLSFLVCALSSSAVADQDGRVDSLTALGQSHLEAGKADRAIQILNEALQLDAERVRTHLLLGRAYLVSGGLDKALEAFENALERDAALAEAQAGIAEVHYRQASGEAGSMSHARKAVSAARRATRLDPTYAPAYLLLARTYIRLNQNYAAALRACKTALELQPHDPETAYLLCTAYIELRDTAQDDLKSIQALLDGATLKRLEPHFSAPRLLPTALQIYLDLKETQKALAFFERHIESLPAEEQTPYRDISSVAIQGEIAAYNRTPEEKRDAFHSQFWAKRAFGLYIEPAERLVEHYRRVRYARTHFAKGAPPWDRRGEIYIRYGEPDYRSSSNRPNLDIPPAVEQVKKRLALALYGPKAMAETFTGPVYPVRGHRPLSLSEPFTTQEDSTAIPWECWIYTRIGEGIEITFTDEQRNGAYGYAPVPDLLDGAGSFTPHEVAQYALYAPRAIAAQSIAEVPELYTSSLEFSYDFADFRASGGTTRLEVYYARDSSATGKGATGDPAAISATCAVTLTDTTYSRIYRKKDPFRDTVIGQGTWIEGVSVSDLLFLDLPSGDYLLTVQFNDFSAERKGTYRRRIHVESYGGETLQLSDIQLSWYISENEGDGKFQKGNFWVIPMTTRTYQEDQNAYAYYELYNLTQNEFGHTRYLTTCTVRAEDPLHPFHPAGSNPDASAKLFDKGTKPELQMRLRRVGAEASTSEYFELDLEKVKSGYNRLTIRVEDLNSGQTAAKEIRFRYKE